MNTNKSNGQLTAQISMQDHKKSGFDLSNNVLGTGKIGRIIPTRALHVMPGDTIKADSKVAVQFEPLAVPILANMDVKQEHFYIPYNVVWKNWDKFVSGGEKMDYQGVVPNISLDQMIYYLDEQFRSIIQFYVSSNEGEYGTLIYPSDALGDNMLDAFNIEVRGVLDSKAVAFQCRDLLKPQYQVLKDLINLPYGYVADSYKEGNGEAYLYKITDANSLDDYLKNYANGNKYITAIKDALKRIFQRNNVVVLPTDSGMQLISLMYEFVKPWIGIGSNIDYLNMIRVTFTDYLYQVINHLTANIFAADDSTSVGLFPGAGTPGRWSNIPMSILHLRANYNVWYNNYRDILLEANAFEPIDTDSITFDELFALLLPRQRCWEKDMFTTALDNPGTGNVVVPLNAYLASADEGINSKISYQVLTESGENRIDNSYVNGDNIYEVSFNDFEGKPSKYRIPTAYLSGVVPKEGENYEEGIPYFSLYTLDAAQRAQKWLQKALFYGNRISDFYYMHFGVRFLDARLRLPELLTSSSELVKLDVVMNNTNITTEAGGEVYQSIAGDRAAYASAYDNGNSFDRFCEEHGVIMSYLTIMPQVTYAHGMNRDYSRLDQFDFAFSEFATLGMDAVFNYEIANPCVEDYELENPHGIGVFGYQGKYYDYKAKHSEEHGELLDSQDMYTFSRNYNLYETYPKLNYEFVHCFPDLDMFVVDSPYADYFRYDIRHSTAAERNLPSQSLYI